MDEDKGKEQVKSTTENSKAFGRKSYVGHS